MKKTISILLCLLLIFSSVSSVFASATSWDTTDQANLQTIKNQLSNTSGGSIYYMISQINAAMRFNNKTIANWLSDIYYTVDNTLWAADGNSYRGVAWWMKEAVLDLDQLVGTGSGSLLDYVSTISTNVNTLLTRVNSILTNMGNIDANIAFIQGDTANIVTSMTTLLGYQLGILGHANNIETYSQDIDDRLIKKSYPTWYQNNPDTTYHVYNGSFSTNNNFTSNNTSILGAIWLATRFASDSVAYLARDLLTGFATSQTYTNWQTLNSGSFTPTSTTNGLYNWLKNIQTPIARLAYVHASDEEIAAREKAEANQTAVVNNFIDSNGSGSAPASSFGDVASMSAGYTSNMGTDASASGIWNIFNSNNFGWFSQETANQLDTTVSTRKGSSDFETPLLDQQTAEIYKELGVDVND